MLVSIILVPRPSHSPPAHVRWKHAVERVFGHGENSAARAGALPSLTRNFHHTPVQHRFVQWKRVCAASPGGGVGPELPAASYPAAARFRLSLDAVRTAAAPPPA